MATPDNTSPELHAAATAPQTPVVPAESDNTALNNNQPNMQQMQPAAKTEQHDDQASQRREQKPYTDGASYIANSLQAMRDAYTKGAKPSAPAPTGSQAVESEAAERETAPAQTQSDPFDPDSFDSVRLNAMQSSVGEAQRGAAEAAAQQVVEAAMNGARMTLSR